MAEIATALIESGGAEKTTRAQAIEINARQNLARKTLSRWITQEDAYAPHLWLPLPAHWTSDAFTAAAEAEGVLVSPASHFATEAPSNHVRLALGAAPDRVTLKESLRKLAMLLEKNPARASRSV